MEKKKLTKSSTDKKICGVCGGIAKYADIDVTILRIIALACLVFTCIVPTLVIYLAAALIMPSEESVTPDKQ